jgi:hypothetical protein
MEIRWIVKKWQGLLLTLGPVWLLGKIKKIELENDYDILAQLLQYYLMDLKTYFELRKSLKNVLDMMEKFEEKSDHDMA